MLDLNWFIYRSFTLSRLYLPLIAYHEACEHQSRGPPAARVQAELQAELDAKNRIVDSLKQELAEEKHSKVELNIVQLGRLSLVRTPPVLFSLSTSCIVW